MGTSGGIGKQIAKLDQILYFKQGRYQKKLGGPTLVYGVGAFTTLVTAAVAGAGIAWRAKKFCNEYTVHTEIFVHQGLTLRQGSTVIVESLSGDHVILKVKGIRNKKSVPLEVLTECSDFSLESWQAPKTNKLRRVSKGKLKKLDAVRDKF
ncbi:MAG: hypothetical protein Q3961_02565 [Bifidobacteriaceae bacterium]|nr:hypothetical protein [Bifidobacteriaceae bacterium]